MRYRVGHGNGKEGEVEVRMSVDDVLQSCLACVVAAGSS